MDGNKTVTATFTEEGVCASPGVPVLQSPVDGSATLDITPQLDWNAATDTSQYEIQIDNDPGFATPDGGTTAATT